MSAHELETSFEDYILNRDDGSRELAFMVEGVRCGACIANLERAVLGVEGVREARLNFSTRRMRVVWRGKTPVLLEAVRRAQAAGYGLTPYDARMLEQQSTREEKWLLRCLAVAGFASMNVMLLSVSLWSGADASASQRALMQWFSALIVMPAVVYSGQPYFRSAYQALRHGRLGMDVPISVALILTTSLSLFDTVVGYGETYFESAAMLLFFLLCGRYLDARVRGRSRSAAEHLMGLQRNSAAVLGARGEVHFVPGGKVQVGAVVLWRPGERLVVDGVVMDAEGSVDTSILTGESLPRSVCAGDAVQAGMVNRGQALRLQTTAVGGKTVLAELARLVETATDAKNGYTRLADRVARRYAPVVHVLALATFSGWMLAGLNWHDSLLRAAAVLIVTCPCALALAVPAVQVAVIGRLLRRGVILKSGEALERLAKVRRVVLDKTGTLTTGVLRLVEGGSAAQRELAARMAVLSRHPLAHAVVASAGGAVKPLPGVREVAGKGLEAVWKSEKVRLGSAAFCGIKTAPEPLQAGQVALWLRQGAKKPVRFLLEDQLRPDAAEALRELAHLGLAPQILSGDAQAAVDAVVARLGSYPARGEAGPKQKQQVIGGVQQRGEELMMVGDGLNDAPSLALAAVGVSFGKASDLAKISADVILQQESLMELPRLWRLARTAQRTVVFNFMISFAYNMVSVPLAMAGYISPLWAALLMSASSVMVVANAARLGRE